jgi:hypothetical protein
VEIICPVNHYCPLASTTTHTCPTGSLSIQGSDAITDCYCPNGWTQNAITYTCSDITAPSLVCPASITTRAIWGGATVTWTAPTPTDTAGGAVTLSADHINGDYYTVGITTVTYVARDTNGNEATCSFTITVTDGSMIFTTGCPSSFSLFASSSNGAVARWTLPVATSDSGTPTVACQPASGDTFSAGTTLSTCTATNLRNETISCQFNITVASGSRVFQWTSPSSINTYRAEATVVSATSLSIADIGTHSDATIIVTISMSAGDSYTTDYGVALLTTVTDVTSVPVSPLTASPTLRLTGGVAAINLALKQLSVYIRSGTYSSVSLSVSDYSNSSASATTAISVSVLCRATTAAPTIASSRLTSTGAAIVVTFNDVYIASTNGSTNCSIWFPAVATSLLGSGSTCIMTSSTTLTITLGTSATVAIGSTLGIASSLVRACLASNLYLTNGYITVLAPSAVATPTVTVSGVNTVIACAGSTFTLKSNAAGASRFSYLWSLPTSITATSGILLTDSSLTVPISSVSAGSSYTFVVTVTSWLGTSASSNFIVTVTNEIVPLLQVSGATTRTVSASVSNQLAVTVSTPSCMLATDAAQGVTFGWSVSSSVTNSALVALLPQSSRISSVTIPSSILVAGESYVFTLVASFISNPGNHSSVTITLIASSVPVAARIANGNRAVSRTSTVTLTSISTAADGVTLSNVWSCTTSDGGDCTLVDLSGALSLTTSSTTGGTTFDASSLFPGSYIITLSVKSSKNDTASTSVIITILTDTAPSLGLATSAAASGVMASSSPLRLSSVLLDSDTSVTYSWSETSGHMDLSSYTSKSLYLNALATNEYWTSGVEYTFRCTATIKGTAKYGYAETTLLVNQSPSGGSIGSDRSTSESMTNTITLSTWGWADANGDAISFQFFYIDVDSGSYVFLGTRSADWWKSGVILPPGDVNSAYGITVGVRATDALGAYADATIVITSTSPSVLSSGDSTALTTYFADRVAEAEATGDTEKLYSVATVIANTLTSKCDATLAKSISSALISGASSAPVNQGVACLTALSNPNCDLGNDTATNVLEVLTSLSERVDVSDLPQLSSFYTTVGQLFTGLQDVDNTKRGTLLLAADDVVRTLATAIVLYSGALQSAGDDYTVSVSGVETSLVLVDPNGDDLAYEVDDTTTVGVPNGIINGNNNVVLRVYVSTRPTETTSIGSSTSQLGASRITIEIATSNGQVYTIFGSSSSTSRRLLASDSSLNVTMAYDSSILSSCGSTSCTPICVAWNSTDNTWSPSSSIVKTVKAANGVATCQLYQSATLSVASTSTTIVDSNGGSSDDDGLSRDEKLYIAGGVLIAVGILLVCFCWYRAGKGRSKSIGENSKGYGSAGGAEMASIVIAGGIADDRKVAAVAAPPANDRKDAKPVHVDPTPEGPVHFVVVSNELDEIDQRFQAANPPSNNGSRPRPVDNFGADGAPDDYVLPPRSPSDGYSDSDSVSHERVVRSPGRIDAGTVAIRNPVRLHDHVF